MKLIISTILLLFFYLSNGQTKPNNFYAGIKYSNNFLTKKKGTDISNPLDKNPINQLEGVQSVYGVFLGYMFNQNIGAEIGYNYYRNSNILEANYILPFSYGKTEQNEILSMNQFKSTLVISGDFKKINPYSKLSLVLGQSVKIDYSLVNSNYVDFTIFNSNSTKVQPSYFNYTSSGGTPIGFNTVFGLEFKIFNTLYLFGEVDYFYMKYAPKKTDFENLELISVSYSGDNVTPEFEYNIASFDSNNKPNNRDYSFNKQLESVRTRIIDNVAFNIGLKMNF